MGVNPFLALAQLPGIDPALVRKENAAPREFGDAVRAAGAVAIEPTTPRTRNSGVTPSTLSREERLCRAGDAWCDGERVVRVADMDALTRRLRAKGWKRLGDGAFGVAWGKGNLVWKVSAKSDDKYKIWAHAVVSGTYTGPHVPRIKMLLVDDTGRCAALMERLEACVYQWKAELRGTRERMLATLTEQAIEGWSQRYNFEAERYEEYHEVIMFPELTSLVRDIRKRIHAEPPENRTAETVPWHSAWPDIHMGNFMFRKDGTPVITDPIS